MKHNFSVVALIFFIIRTFFSLISYHDILSLMLSLILGIILIFIAFQLNFKKSILFSLLSFSILIFYFVFILIDSAFFINTHYFQTNNLILIIPTLLLLVFIIGKNKLQIISSMSNILMFFFILTFIILVIGIFPSINTNHSSVSPMFSLLPFGFLFITSTFKDKKRDVYQGYFIASIVILIEMILSTLSLGYLISNTYLYTHVSIINQLTHLSFLGSLEIFFSFSHLFGNIITLSIILYLTKKRVYDSILQVKPKDS